MRYTGILFQAHLHVCNLLISYLVDIKNDTLLSVHQVLATLQEVQNIIHKCLAAHDKLESSLRDLSRTGDIQTCKAARKSTDSLLKDLSKELRPLLASLQSFPSASHISPKVSKFPSTGYSSLLKSPQLCLICLFL